jgi:predicted Zn-dependent protease
VMRLKAFWYLKEGKYTMARSLLQQLINKNENDLETGINMAVLDIKTNRVEAARKRLRKLRRLHEENTMIPALLEKINR